MLVYVAKRKDIQHLDFWIIRDNVSFNRKNIKQTSIGAQSPNNPINVQLYRVKQCEIEIIDEFSYKPGSIRQVKGGKASIALSLLKRANIDSGVVVASPTYGNSKIIIPELIGNGLDFVLGLSPNTKVKTNDLNFTIIEEAIKVEDLLEKASWEDIKINLPQNIGSGVYTASDLGQVVKDNEKKKLRLFAFAIGGLKNFRRNLLFGITTLLHVSLKELIEIFGWVRWLQPICRRNEKNKILANEPKINTSSTRFKKLFRGQTSPVRATIKISKEKDKTDLKRLFDQNLHYKLTKNKPLLNVVELFAGAGGMGLGFLLATHKNFGYKIIYSGEVSPICVQTLRFNHKYMDSLYNIGERKTPTDLVAEDLRLGNVQKKVKRIAKEAGGVDILIGGPPCQGFSNANRNNWYSGNPNNQLINTFFDYVSQLMPKVFLLENVQGILWTPKTGDNSSNRSVANHISEQLACLGYLVFPQLLDAVWYGVPQFRSRFFLIGIHADLNYKIDDFGERGPFPKPTHGPGTQEKYVTVKDAIGDLPPIANGQYEEWLAYKNASISLEDSNYFLHEVRKHAPTGKISDHVTSRHADYVISRYKLISPGNNWQSIAHLMTNYTDISRTHSNIYRRLVWDEPSVTIGHYRKSMLVHPEQHRGLSLREASRLQSFPDWFRFAGSDDGNKRGLMYKQQQLANAVCPLLTKAIAEYILGL